MRNRKIVGWTALAALGCVVVGMGILIAILNSTHWDASSKILVRPFERLTGYEINRLDRLDIDIGRNVSFRLDNMELHPKKEEKDKERTSAWMQSMRVGHAEGTISIGSLFGSGIILKNVELVDTSIRLDERQMESKVRPESWSRFLKAMPSAYIDRARIRNLRLAYYDPNEKETLAFAMKDLVIEPDAQTGDVSLNADASIGELPLQLKGNWGSREKFEDERSAMPLELRLSGGNDIYMELKGQLHPSRETSSFLVNAPRFDFNPFAKALRLQVGRLPLMSLVMSLEKSGDRIRSQDFTMRLGETRFMGSLSSDFSGNRPVIHADMRSPVIHVADVSGFLVPRPENDKGRSETLLSRDILPVEMLQGLEASLRLKVPAQEAADTDANTELLLHDVDVEAVLKDKKLTVEPLSFALAQGRVVGVVQASLENNPIEMSWNLAVRNLQLDNLLRAFPEDLPVLKAKAADIIQGRLIGNIAIQSRGRSIHELAANASGRSQFAVEDGKLSKAASEAFGFNLPGALAGLFQDRPMADLQCMISSFVGKDGIFRTQAWVVSTPDVNIHGRGSINLGKEAIDMTLEARPRKAVVGAVIRPIRVTGKLNQLSVELGKEGNEQPTSRDDEDKSIGETLAAIMPFVEPASDKESSCRNYVATLNQIRARSQPGAAGTVLR